MIAAGLGSSLIRFRGELIKSWLEMGHTVAAAAPGDEVAEEMKALGVDYYTIKLRRSGLNPAADLWLLLNLKSLMRRIKPDYLFFYTAKPVIYGSLAAYCYRRGMVFSLISGLGYVFSNQSGKTAFLKKLIVLLYRAALKRNKLVFFQNPDDSSVFKDLNIVKAEQVIQVNGSGVDTKYFSVAPLPGEKATFLLIARMVREKGFVEYAEAARIIKRKYPQARFMIIAWSLEDTPSSLKPEELEAWQEEGIIEVYGETEDVRPFIARADIYVLPSYYGEGTPRTVLEAMAMGRPVITTDAPGCRETVIDGANGFLVPVKDSEALAGAMEKFILDPALTGRMGAESRRIAEEKYDVRKVNQKINRAMGLL